ncbi:hypothetical protein PGT21_022776 [Puccinia graminis f. sp. tritici]|uniref:Uroporphyrinogen-III cosynthase n=1 Tax=Puccinia graminis f. sp. tritici TaxID=56615 RepID=A0A5B0NET5_PUCGR|nr:hypothetical protein PGT21_022776 [Puccinia graminis f. sp. tritici]
MDGSSQEEVDKTKKKQKIILIKTPNESTGYQEDEYTKTFGSTGAYEPIFISILRTRVSSAELGELSGTLRTGARGMKVDGVVLTSARSVDSLQLAINQIHHESTDDQDAASSSSDWGAVPFFVVGTSTRLALLALNTFNNPHIFPDPKNGQITILGHNEAGSGHKLAEFIKTHFSSIHRRSGGQQSYDTEERRKDGDADPKTEGLENMTTTVRLLYLVGSHQDSSLSENLSKHNNNQENDDGEGDQRGRIRYELVSQRVYSIEPETEPRFEPPELFVTRNTSTDQTDDRGTEEEEERRKEEEDRDRLEEEIAQELGLLRQRSGNQRRDHWLVFFSPNSSRILLDNTNDLLLQIKRKFASLHPHRSSSDHQILSNEENEEPGLLFHLDAFKVAAIGATTATFLASHYYHSFPIVVPDKPNPASLLQAILDFDNLPPPVSSSSD